MRCRRTATVDVNHYQRSNEEEANVDNGEQASNQWVRYGFLFADLFTALAMLFLLTGTAGVAIATQTDATPVATTTVLPTAEACGLEQTPVVPAVLAIADPAGLRAGSATAQTALATQVRQLLSTYANRSVGLVEVNAGSLNGTLDIANGIQLANGAIGALKLLAQDNFLFSTTKTLFQPYWNGDLLGNQVKLVMFLYQTAGTGQCT